MPRTRGVALLFTDFEKDECRACEMGRHLFQETPHDAQPIQPGNGRKTGWIGEFLLTREAALRAPRGYRANRQ